MTYQEMQRRNLLRGVLAAGCALYLPLLAGCRDQTLPRAEPNPNPGDSPSPTAEIEQPSAPVSGKISQVEAQYQAEPMGEQSCAMCMNFISESNTCKVVEGQVAPQGRCKLWVGKLT